MRVCGPGAVIRQQLAADGRQRRARCLGCLAGQCGVRLHAAGSSRLCAACVVCRPAQRVLASKQFPALCMRTRLATGSRCAAIGTALRVLA